MTKKHDHDLVSCKIAPMTSLNIKEIGVDVNIYQPVELIRPENLVLKNHIIISAFAYVAAGLGTWIGNHIHIAAHSSISGGGYCVMEDFSGIAAGARLITGSANVGGFNMTSPTLPPEFQDVERSFIHMGKHSAVFTNAVVFAGVTIGEGAIVSVGSVVKNDLEPWTIYAGNPARKIAKRPRRNILKQEELLYELTNLTPSNFSKEIEFIKSLKN